ncbi:MAG: hypothetical protein ACI87E_000972 [Mariniblastus sp.]|jgi:hypothetical protein
MKANPQQQIGLRDVSLVFLVGILSFVIHEFAHWACGELLGYDMFVGINKAGLAVGEYSQDWHNKLVSAAGPLMTISIAISGLWLIYRFQ